MYSFQNFSVGQVLTASQMQQAEVNIRDHEHGRSPGLSKINAVVTKSADYTATVADYGTLFIFTASATLTLPNPTLAGPAWFCKVYAQGDGVMVTLSGTGIPTNSRVFKGQLVDIYGLSTSAFVANTSLMNEVLSSQATFASTATGDFAMDADGDCDLHRFELHEIVPVTDNVSFQIRVSVDGGPTFLAGASDYRVGRNVVRDSAANVPAGSTGATSIIAVALCGNATGESVSGTVWVFWPTLGTKYKQIMWLAGHLSSTPEQSATYGAGACVNAGALGDVTDIRFMMSSGNILSGQISHYKIRAASLLPS